MCVKYCVNQDSTLALVHLVQANEEVAVGGRVTIHDTENEDTFVHLLNNKVSVLDLLLR